MKSSWWSEKVLPGLIGAVILFVLLLIWSGISGRPIFGGVSSDQLKAAIDEIQLTPGPAGPKGDAGPAGPKGDAGPAGPAGPRTWVPRVTLALPVRGPGSLAPAPKVTLDPAGPAGPKGDAGPAGPAGPKGDAGPAGPAGPAALPVPPAPRVTLDPLARLARLRSETSGRAAICRPDHLKTYPARDLRAGYVHRAGGSSLSAFGRVIPVSLTARQDRFSSDIYQMRQLNF